MIKKLENKFIKNEKTTEIEDLVKKELYLPCQVGFPTQVEGVVDKIDDPCFATAVGLLQWQLKESFGGSGKKGNAGKKMGAKFSKIKKWLESLLP